MPKILINYKITNDNTLEIKNYGVVFYDMPIAIADYDYDYEEPVLANAGLNYPIVLEKAELLKQLKGKQELKKFKFKVNEDTTVKETTGKADVTVELPKDTDISKLRYINNQIVLLDEEVNK
jgi:hypothetical protein